MTETFTVSVGSKGSDEMKSRDGNEMMDTGRVGGSFTTGLAGAWAVVVDTMLLKPERLPTASRPSTLQAYVPGGTFLSTNVFGAGASAPLIWPVAISTPSR